MKRKGREGLIRREERERHGDVTWMRRGEKVAIGDPITSTLV